MLANASLCPFTEGTSLLPSEEQLGKNISVARAKEIIEGRK